MNGRLLSLLQASNGGDLLVPMAVCFPCKWSVFLARRLMTRCLDLVGFRETVKTRFCDVIETAVN